MDSVPAARDLEPSPGPPVLICNSAFLNQSKTGRLIYRHRIVLWPLSVMRTPVALPPILEWMEQRMPERRRFRQKTSVEERLAKEATQLRKQAQGTPLGIERDLFVRKARRAETASHMTEWLASAYKRH